MKFLIWSNQQQAWWGPNELGYTSLLEEAGRYDAVDAQRIVAKTTLDGSLRRDRLGRNGALISVVDEVMVLAPESLATASVIWADAAIGGEPS